MLIVTDLNGQSEPLIDYKDLEIVEEINGDFSITFTSINTPNNEFAFPLLNEESIIQTEDGHEFRIKKMRNNRNRKIINLAQHIFFDLNGDQVYDIIGGSQDANEMFSFILKDTGWTFEVMDDIPYKLFTNFGQDNVVSLIRKTCEILECEIKIEPNKHLKIYKQMGSDDDFQYRYKYNIKGLQQDIDTTNLTTVVKGFGANGMVITYTSPNAAVLGEIHASPIRDEQIENEAEMIELLKQEINDIPNISIEVEEIELEETRQLGDKVWLIYEPLNIEFQTRIIARKTYPDQVGKNTVTFGSFKQEISNIVAETARETNKNRSKIDQTSDRITLTVERIDESIAQLNMTADEITLSVQNLGENLRSEISITDKQIRSMVSQEVKTLNDRVDTTNSTITQTASSIRSEVNSQVNRLDGAISSANSSITQLSNRITSEVSEINYDMSSMRTQINQTASEISSKVSKTDYNGLTISSLINQDAYRIQLSAQAIDLQGITNVASQLTLGTGWSGYASLRFNGQANIYTNDGSDLNISAANVSMTGGTVYTGTLYSNNFGFSNYGGGFAMYDYDWIRTINGVGFYVPGEIKANKVTNLSHINYKENIALFSESAMDIITSHPIYRYNYKREYDKKGWTKRRTGLIIDEENRPFSPLLKSDDDGVDLYAVSMINWKGTQELIKEFNLMKQELNSLKEKLNGSDQI
nr:phage tail spike protein [Heyndrickxia oleronia]